LGFDLWATLRAEAAVSVPRGILSALFPSQIIATRLTAPKAKANAHLSRNLRDGRRDLREPSMHDLLREYLPILIFIALAIVLGLVLVLAAAVLAVRNPDPEKVSAYECGFNAFDDARMKFDVRFYLVSILFIIFDLEVAFLFPWAVAFGDISMVGFWSMMVFLGVLTVGFAYEWKKGALEWA
jgi:NADH-quinone oxidoreductase subunit A